MSISSKLQHHASVHNSDILFKFFSDKRRVYDTDTLENHVYVNCANKGSVRDVLINELDKIGLKYTINYSKKQFYFCIDITNL